MRDVLPMLPPVTSPSISMEVSLPVTPSVIISGTYAVPRVSRLLLLPILFMEDRCLYTCGRIVVQAIRGKIYPEQVIHLSSIHRRTEISFVAS
jgi:hypothetical protein